VFEDNVIWVDFRLSKDIRDRQGLSFADRMKAHSERTRGHIEASRGALDEIRRMLSEKTRSPDGTAL